MRPRRTAGYTLVELLIVVGIIVHFAATFLPDLLSGRLQANIAADCSNLSRHYQWLDVYRSPTKVGHMPTESGRKFLLDTWVRGVIDPTVENFDRFFTPGIREVDPRWIELRKKIERGEKIWTDLGTLTSLDTHYAARAKQHIRGMIAPTEAWIANDNEAGWAFQDGTVNILWGNGRVQQLSLAKIVEQFKWQGPEVFKTWGPDSLHPALRKLEN